MLAQEVVQAVLAVVLVSLLLAGLADVTLFLEHRLTISAWLREHPGYFWLPAGLMVAFLILLALHLFVFPWPE